MTTRSGSADPGLLLRLLEPGGLAAPVLADALEHRSRLLGLAGTADMRELVERDTRGDPRARRRCTPMCVGCAARSPQWPRPCAGLDVLVFAGGVGETPPKCARARRQAWRSSG
jgi:acetate kinase